MVGTRRLFGHVTVVRTPHDQRGNGDGARGLLLLFEIGVSGVGLGFAPPDAIGVEGDRRPVGILE